MKIAIIGTRGIPAHYGGFETCAEEISIGLVNKGHRVTVYCRYGNEPGKPKNYKNVNLIYVPHLDSKNIGTISHSLCALIHSLFCKYNVTLVFNVGLAPLCIIPKVFGKKIILNVDGLEWKRKKWGSVAKKYFLFCEIIAHYFTDAIITDSKAIQKYYEQKYNVKSTYIAYGANIDKSRDNSILSKYNVTKNEYFFIASRLEPENNADLIIEAFAKLKTNKKLIIAGGANYKSSYIEKLKKIKDKRIKLLGPIYNENHIRELHCNCFAYIHGNEVGGTNPALLKAMGYGNCVIALNVSYNKEVLRDSGFYFEKSKVSLMDTLVKLLNNSKLVLKYRKKAITRIKKTYLWEKIVNEYENLIINTVKKNV